MATNILSQEEKRYLRSICRYLGSLGMKEGLISFDLTEGPLKRIDWKYVTHFSNNYNADIPDGFIPILKKIIKFVIEEDLIEYSDEGTNYESVDISIDCESGEISVSYYYSYYDTDNGQSTSWELEEMDDDEKNHFEEIFQSLRVLFPKKDSVEIEYDGGGDSGYIKDYFTDTSIAVPNMLESWCYDVLESNFGGWEINEGSQGNFYIDLKNNIIELNHYYNVEQTENDTVWEENFQ